MYSAQWDWPWGISASSVEYLSSVSKRFNVFRQLKMGIFLIGERAVLERAF